MIDQGQNASFLFFVGQVLWTDEQKLHRFVGKHVQFPGRWIINNFGFQWYFATKSTKVLPFRIIILFDSQNELILNYRILEYQLIKWSWCGSVIDILVFLVTNDICILNILALIPYSLILNKRCINFVSFLVIFNDSCKIEVTRVTPVE